MIKHLQKRFALYAQTFNLGLQSSLVYRWNFFLRAAFSFIPLIASIFLWGAVFHDRAQFSGYSYPLMISYFISMVILDAISTSGDQEFQMAEEIKEGRISQILIKPIGFLPYRLSIFLATRCTDCAIALGPVTVIVFFLRSYFKEVPVLHTLFFALVASAGSGLLQFAFSYAVAMLAFWLLEISATVFIIFALDTIAGGRVFPLDLLPARFYHLANSLPFAYEYYFPVEVFLGRVRGWHMAFGFMMQAFWILFFFCLGHVVWRRGLKKYTSVGG